LIDFNFFPRLWLFRSQSRRKGKKEQRESDGLFGSMERRTKEGGKEGHRHTQRSADNDKGGKKMKENEGAREACGFVQKEKKKRD